MAQTKLTVNCLKIINWLEDRHKLSKDWYNFQKAAEEKIKELFKDQHSYIEQEQIYNFMKTHADNFYFGDLCELVDLLLKTKWAQNKSLVFGYSDHRVKEWTKLKKFMEGKQLHIVNTAKFIRQGLQFDLPSVDKNIQLLDSQITSLKRKIDMNNNAIFQQEKQETSERLKLKLQPSRSISVSEQIPALIKELPQLFAQVEQASQQLKPMIVKYKKFCGDDSDIDMVVLEHFINNGNDYYCNLEGEHKVLNADEKYQNFMNWKPFNEWGIQTEGAIIEKQSELMTILEKRKSRVLFLQNLNQLLYFFKGIKYEMSQKLSNFEEENDMNMVESEVDHYIDVMEGILLKINGDIVTRIEMKNDSQIYQIILKKFKAYSQNTTQMMEQNKDFAIQIQKMGIQREELVQQLRNLRGRVIESKNRCEQYLSDLIKREVRIIGEINKLE